MKRESVNKKVLCTPEPIYFLVMQSFRESVTLSNFPAAHEFYHSHPENRKMSKQTK